MSTLPNCENKIMALINRAPETREWYVDGKLHSVHIRPNGAQYWYVGEQLHREDGPACTYPSGTQFWYLNDNLHRVDGPAIIYADGAVSWYIDDCIYCTPKQFQTAAKLSDEDMTALLLKYKF